MGSNITRILTNHPTMSSESGFDCNINIYNMYIYPSLLSIFLSLHPILSFFFSFSLTFGFSTYHIWLTFYGLHNCHFASRDSFIHFKHTSFKKKFFFSFSISFFLSFFPSFLFLTTLVYLSLCLIKFFLPFVEKMSE